MCKSVIACIWVRQVVLERGGALEIFFVRVSVETNCLEDDLKVSSRSLVLKRRTTESEGRF